MTAKPNLLHRTYSTIVVAALVLSSSAGCRLCDNSEDLAYPTYGGAWERTLRDSGRVGSVFDPGGVRSAALVSRDTTIPPDELERSRREPSEERRDNIFEDEADQAEQDTDSQADTADDDGSFEEDPRFKELNEDDDPGLEERKRKLREKEGLQEIKVIPGNTMPPLFR